MPHAAMDIFWVPMRLSFHPSGSQDTQTACAQCPAAECSKHCFFVVQAWRIAEHLGLIGPAVEQPEYNMFARKKVEQEFTPIYKSHGLGLTIWSPLASGVLTGKYSGGNIPKDSRFALEQYKGMGEKALAKRKQIEAVDQLKPIADELGCSLAQLGLAWCVKNPHVSTVITGSTKIEQVKDNMGAITVVPKLTDKIMKRIEDIIGPAVEAMEESASS
eukprot:GHRR01002844.1.p1 GENE.GHRR01002844.1~~GHRR01002844.1.p1  ORF type:complete len:217 (+),score=72.75 GHRR01002844.1:837-1487(+)